MINPQTMLPIECNEAAHRQLEYSREEFARLRSADHKAHETPEETKVHVEKVVREGRDDFETRHRTKQGDIRDVLVTAREQPEAQHGVQSRVVLQPREAFYDSLIFNSCCPYFTLFYGGRNLAQPFG